jgi:hypothetical protein
MKLTEEGESKIMPLYQHRMMLSHDFKVRTFKSKSQIN